MKIALLALIAVLSQNVFAAERGARFQNLDQMIEELNLRPYFRRNVTPEKNLKVAIFDNGFRDAESEIGKSLPESTQIHNGPVPIEGEEEIHGFYMARIFWSLLSLNGKDDRYAPTEFHLYKTFGYSNLKSAVEDAIAKNVDVVLYSQTWEYGGNFDGKGFINQLINKATSAGILWINNAGNFGNSTFNSAIKTGHDDWVELPGQNQSVEVRCESDNPNGKCNLRSVLSWNDFSNDVEEGTDKDLDFVLTDDTLNIIQSSSLTQSPNPPEGQPGTSKYPREIITAELQPGLYFLRVKNRSKNFKSKDRLRITVSGDFLTMANADKEESLLPPADNPRVITVGALDSERTSISKRMNKPEVWTNSLVSLSKEENFKGTSNSAAMVAAGVTILLSLDPDLSREQILKRTSFKGSPSYGDSEPGMGLPLEQLGFAPTTNACFRPLDPENQPDFVQNALTYGGTLVDTTAGAKVFYPFDPIRLLPGIIRRLPNDILVLGANGPGIFHRSALFQIGQNGLIELVQTPYGQRICTETGNGTAPVLGKIFRLPKK